MSVSYTDRVVGLEGLNEDGIRLIDQVSYKGKNSEEMTQLLVERAVEMGYLKDGGTVSVKAQGSAGWKDKRENAISSGLSHMLEGRMRVEIKIGAAEEETIPETPASQAPASTAHHPTPSVHPVAAPVATESSRQEERNKKHDDDGLDDDDRDDDGYNDGDDDQDDRDDDRDDGDDDQEIEMTTVIMGMMTKTIGMTTVTIGMMTKTIEMTTVIMRMMTKTIEMTTVTIEMMTGPIETMAGTMTMKKTMMMMIK